MPPSSTFFTASPHWNWLIIVYFFVGGLAGGCYFLAVLIDFFDRATDRPLARLGYYVKSGKLSGQFGHGVYLGGWVEAGNAWANSAEVRTFDRLVKLKCAAPKRFVAKRVEAKCFPAVF